MKPPEILTSFKDPVTEITWHVAAYRKLSTEEAVRAVRNYFLTHKVKKKPVKGKSYRIDTLIGARDD